MEVKYDKEERKIKNGRKSERKKEKKIKRMK
jgi:hypothetical protein